MTQKKKGTYLIHKASNLLIFFIVSIELILLFGIYMPPFSFPSLLLFIPLFVHPQSPPSFVLVSLISSHLSVCTQFWRNIA